MTSLTLTCDFRSSPISYQVFKMLSFHDDDEDLTDDDSSSDDDDDDDGPGDNDPLGTDDNDSDKGESGTVRCFVCFLYHSS